MSTGSLSARSIIASTLLGTHPPAMPGRLLVALASRFGVAQGTPRVALSRMVERGELTNDNGTYTLAGHLVGRQRRQDEARASGTLAWDGDWHQAVIITPAAPSRRMERRHDLQLMKLAELREGVWLRPANLDRRRLVPESGAEDVLWGTTRPAGDPRALVARLWDLDGWATEARRLIVGLHEAVMALDDDNDDVLAPGFELSAAVLRHLVADPELPGELEPGNWPTVELRRAYDGFDAAYRRLLGRFFATHQ